jgi:hypothetical protein
VVERPGSRGPYLGTWCAFLGGAFHPGAPDGIAFRRIDPVSVLVAPANAESGDFTGLDEHGGGVSVDASAALSGTYGYLFTGDSGYIGQESSIADEIETWDGFGLEIPSGLILGAFGQVLVYHALIYNETTYDIDEVKIALVNNNGSPGPPTDWRTSVPGSDIDVSTNLTFDTRLWVTPHIVCGASGAVAVNVDDGGGAEEIASASGIDWTGYDTYRHRLGPETDDIGVYELSMDDWVINDTDEPSNPYTGASQSPVPIIMQMQ